MDPRIRKVICTTAAIVVLSFPVAAQNRAAQRSIFIIHTDEFWLNLHHFLYVLGRAQNNERDASREAVAGAPSDQERALTKLTTSDQKIWRDAVAAYAAGPSKKDIVFDDPLPAFGIWQRGLRSFKAPLDEIWKPYLEGQGTRDEALTALIKRTAIDPPK